MRILVSVMPFTGHVVPVVAVVAELVHRGHEVEVLTGSRFHDRIADTGARSVPWRAAPDFDERDLTATFPQTGRGGPAGLRANVEHVFIRTGAGQARDLLAAAEARRPDIIVGDVMSLGTGLAAELAGVPWATLSIVPLSMPSRDLPPSGLGLRPGRGPLGRARDGLLRAAVDIGGRPLERAHREVRAELGLPPGRPIGDAWYSERLVLASGGPSIEYPRSDLPAAVRFVGRLATDEPRPRLPRGARPRVLVTQGTFDTDPPELAIPAMTALGGRDLDVVVTTGRRGVTTLGLPAPPNVTVVDLLDFTEELPGIDVFVTNGGWGGTLQALANGVPLVVAGGDLDKPDIAARVDRSGAGIDLRTGTPRAAAIGAAVDRVLAEPSFAARAATIAAELAALGGTRAAAELIEGAAS
jgi:UDP:flavonoid glycosyltransferase YjiC (YdhE family)